jgi:hypothetical protein
VKLLVRIDSLLELLLAHITPRANSVADDLDVKIGHPAKRGPEHALKRIQGKTRFFSEVMEGEGSMYSADGVTKRKKRGEEL